jgi:hypothetical protein
MVEGLYTLNLYGGRCATFGTAGRVKLYSGRCPTLASAAALNLGAGPKVSLRRKLPTGGSGQLVALCRAHSVIGTDPTNNKALARRASLFVGSLTMTYFRAVYPALSSALRRFTVLFGMGRRGANALWSSEKTVARQASACPTACFAQQRWKK